MTLINITLWFLFLFQFVFVNYSATGVTELLASSTTAYAAMKAASESFHKHSFLLFCWVYAIFDCLVHSCTFFCLSIYLSTFLSETEPMVSQKYDPFHS